MPASSEIKATRVQINVSLDAQDRLKNIARRSGFNYVPGLLTHIAENFSHIEPERFLEAMLAAKQAGKMPEPAPAPRPIGRPPLNKAS